jgi:hypothetical protein
MLNLVMHPFGYTPEKQLENKTYEFTCFGGEQGCRLDLEMVCIMEKMKNKAQLYFPVIVCLMKEDHDNSEKCLEKSSQKLKYDDVKNCATVIRTFNITIPLTDTST